MGLFVTVSLKNNKRGHMRMTKKKAGVALKK